MNTALGLMVKHILLIIIFLFYFFKKKNLPKNNRIVFIDVVCFIAYINIAYINFMYVLCARLLYITDC